jgi:hypothetical protein
MLNFMKIYSVEPELLHGGVTDRWTEGRPDRRTDMTKLTVALHNFPKASKIRVLV